VSVPSAVAQGNTLLVRLVIREGSDTDPVAVTDSRGNTYTTDVDALRPTKIRTVVFSAHVATPLGAGDSITVTHPAGKGQVVVVDEFAGIAAVNRVNSFSTGSGNSRPFSAQVTTTNAKVLLYGVLGTRTVPGTTPSGWTALGGQVTGNCLVGGSPAAVHAAYRTTIASGEFTYHPDATSNDEWAIGLVAYNSEVDITPPQAPALSGTPGDTQNTLAWSPVFDPSPPVTYQVYRDGVVVYDGTATSFTDTGLANRGTYTYVVRATDGAGNQSVASNGIVLIPSPITLVKTVGTLSCGAGGGTIAVPPAGVPAGRTLIVRVTVRAGVDANAVTVTDPKGTIYQLDGQGIWPTNKVRTLVFSGRVATALASPDVITISHGSGVVQAGVTEWAGIAEHDRVHTVGVGSGSSNTPGAALTIAEPSTLLFVAAGTRANRTFVQPQDAGWGFLPAIACTTGTTADSHAAHRLTSTAGSKPYAATLSGGNDEWAVVMVAYRPE
jgi:hypothetical protein